MKSFKVCVFMVCVPYKPFSGDNSHFEGIIGQRENLVGIYMFNLATKFIFIRFFFQQGVYPPLVISLMNAF